MIIEEFSNYTLIKDENNPFCNVYTDGENVFYIEPGFYAQMEGFKEKFANKFPLIIQKIVEVVNKNHFVVFTGDFENCQTTVDNKYIFLEITDITDPLLIFADDKSRGSDYGD